MPDPEFDPAVIKAQLECGLQYVTNPTPQARESVFGPCNASLYFMRNSPEATPQAIVSGLAAVVHFIEHEDTLDAEEREEMAEHIRVGIAACNP